MICDIVWENAQFMAFISQILKVNIFLPSVAIHMNEVVRKMPKTNIILKKNLNNNWRINQKCFYLFIQSDCISKIIYTKTIKY